ncbi:Surface lipoprotein-like protein [Thioalkalivibrio sulfidiphilus HL-EbGr7]|uniref:Surface lipoprotein-like protein n=1 Tax=Thioalkalivibrio sulfidiphilus (strain HL-EbGR7) TaxID=396588 RepID=B8GLH3_THISH|nr:VacJ family lipoprotein [Thioalkalivibrio sulfidiphilus]ACL73528.1 Surface lipoprotein-like protein [Thioalkalivibrio sulfidiphilus HL-EbGr7]
MTRPSSYIRLVWLLCAAWLLVGCASTQGPRDPADPWEGYNRAMFQFNEAVDKAVLKPVAQGYVKVTPRPVRTGIGNFFANLGDVTNLFNNILQLKFEPALNDFGRITFNSTIGLLGILDVASHMDLPKSNEDFGQTLGHWGVPSGPYLVLPLLGPSTVRDAPSLYVDALTNPLYYHEPEGRRNILAGVYVIDTRAGFLATEQMLDGIAADRYSAIRDFYLQRREFLVHNGEARGRDVGADLFDELEALEVLEAEEARQRQEGQ